MVLMLLIVLLWLVGFSLRITSSGINALSKIDIKTKELSNDTLDKVNTVRDVTVKASTTTMHIAIKVIDIIRNLLTALLPSVLVLDVIVFVLIVGVSSGYLLLLEDPENIPVRDTSVMVSASDDSDNSGSSSLNLSGKGGDVIEEALKYVDVLPYVWGGTSLETGADCSGFVCAVYEKCGYDLWASRVDLVTVGEEVPDISKAQAGDILIYSGHVALYDGNGGRIHAPETGRMVAHETDLGDYYAIRRVIT